MPSPPRAAPPRRPCRRSGGRGPSAHVATESQRLQQSGKRRNKDHRNGKDFGPPVQGPLYIAPPSPREQPRGVQGYSSLEASNRPTTEPTTWRPAWSGGTSRKGWSTPPPPLRGTST